ncbi:hypothetical protein GS601_04240 [Myxacorys almedinensis A]|uniref:Uncharacterized protein n=2 Tax=Myxacorys TaxID=2056239 RepID=A0A8J7YXN6_9CYAN|nr:hypothetical protein [Myxacorys almedinensis A]
MQALIRPMLFAALGLHALVLFVPFPKEPQKPPENKESPVKITQLPTTKSPAQNKTLKAAIAKPNKPTLPKINRATPNPVIQKSPVQPKAAEAPSPAKSQTLSKATDNMATSFADFPQYQPSTPDCFEKGLGENCRIATANLAAIATFYQSAPKAKGFTVTPAEESAVTKIFSVTSKSGETRYLSLFSDEPTTVILLSSEKITDLASLKGSVNPPADYVELLANVLPEGDRSDSPANNANPEQFDQPQMFYNIVNEAELQQGTIPDLRPGIDTSPKLAIGQAPAVFYSATLEPELKGIFQEVVKQGQYGGGDLYRLKKGGTTIYLNLIPVKGQEGTIVVTWLKDPTQS